MGQSLNLGHMTIAKILIMKFFLLNKLNPVLKLGYGLLISPAGDLGDILWELQGPLTFE